MTSECVDCGHCAELYTPKDSDPKELKATRQFVLDKIDEWTARPSKQGVFLSE